MGNYKFRLSNMMPNAWLYKLKGMTSSSSSSTTHPHHRASKKNNNNKKLQLTSSPLTPKLSRPPQQQPNLQPNRSTCYISSRPQLNKLTPPHFPLDSPRKSTKKSRRKPRTVSAKSPETPSNQRDYFIDGEFNTIPSWSSSSSCTLTTSATEIIIDIAPKKPEKPEEDDGFGSLELPPIQTKPARQNVELVKFIDKKVDSYSPVRNKGNAKRSPTGLHRLRIRANSPRLSACRDGRKSNVSSGGKTAARRVKTKGISECFAVVKSSFDPQSDFRESMVEMIVENDIRKAKDLEELLACYLSLNSNEYHDVIVKVFQQIWFDLTKKL